MQRLGVYIHWPFCRSKCPYCNFFSQVHRDVNQQELIDSYLDDLTYYRSLNDAYQVESVFFGGGTPSLIEPKNIERIIDKITSLWPCCTNLEISLEANPNTDDGHLFADLRQAGINRLSLGVQALSEKDLKFLGRTHSLQQALSSIDSVVHNFDNHSIDLIYARPNQQAEDWQKELEQACSLGLKHLSLYQLTIEPNTIFSKKGVQSAEDEIARQLYDVSEKVLAEKGYHRYEVSNYAQNGVECHHNLGYWQGYDYLGIGNGGVGRIHTGGKLFHTSYPRQSEEITPQERAEELLIMGLRTTEGINKNIFISQCGLPLEHVVNLQVLEQFKQDGFLFEDNRYLRTTSSGNFVLNYIIEHLCDL